MFIDIHLFCIFIYLTQIWYMKISTVIKQKDFLQSEKSRNNPHSTKTCYVDLIAFTLQWHSPSRDTHVINGMTQLLKSTITSSDSPLLAFCSATFNCQLRNEGRIKKVENRERKNQTNFCYYSRERERGLSLLWNILTIIKHMYIHVIRYYVPTSTKILSIMYIHIPNKEMHVGW